MRLPHFVVGFPDAEGRDLRPGLAAGLDRHLGLEQLALRRPGDEERQTRLPALNDSACQITLERRLALSGRKA